MARSEMTPGQLLTQLQHEQQARVDVVLNTQAAVSLEVVDEQWAGDKPATMGLQHVAAPIRQGLRLQFDTPDLPELNGSSLPINRWAHQQMASRSQVPWKYYERMMQEQPELLVRNMHTWWRAEPEDRLVRALLPNGGPGKVRAWLSDSFRILDNKDFVTTVLEAAEQVGGIEVHSCHVDDERLYLQLISRDMRAEFRPTAYGALHRGEQRGGGRPIGLGITVRNSEVGDGAVMVQPWVLDFECTNGVMVSRNLGQEGFRRTHLGSGYEHGIISHETVAKENDAIWSLVRDWVRNAMSPEHLNRVLVQMGRADKTTTPAASRPAVANVVRKLGMSTGEAQALLDRYLMDTHINGTSQYGMVQALTQVAHEVPSGYRRQVELEEVGGKLLEMDGSRYQAMVTQPLTDEELATILG